MEYRIGCGPTRRISFASKYSKIGTPLLSFLFANLGSTLSLTLVKNSQFLECANKDR